MGTCLKITDLAWIVKNQVCFFCSNNNNKKNNNSIKLQQILFRLRSNPAAAAKLEKNKQIYPQRHDLRNFRLFICLERTFLRASAAASAAKSSISDKKSTVISVQISQLRHLLEIFEDKTSSDKSFLLLLLNQGIRRRQRRRKSKQLHTLFEGVDRCLFSTDLRISANQRNFRRQLFYSLCVAIFL